MKIQRVMYPAQDFPASRWKGRPEFSSTSRLPWEQGTKGHLELSGESWQCSRSGSPISAQPCALLCVGRRWPLGGAWSPGFPVAAAFICSHTAGPVYTATVQWVRQPRPTLGSPRPHCEHPQSWAFWAPGLCPQVLSAGPELSPTCWWMSLTCLASAAFFSLSPAVCACVHTCPHM